MIDKISANSDSEEEVTPEATSGDAPTAASNPLRSLEWYLDGRLAGANAAGANVEAVSTEYTGHGVMIGLVDEGFDITNPDLAGRFDLAASYDPRDPGPERYQAGLCFGGTWHLGCRRGRRCRQQRLSERSVSRQARRWPASMRVSALADRRAPKWPIYLRTR